MGIRLIVIDNVQEVARLSYDNLRYNGLFAALINAGCSNVSSTLKHEVIRLSSGLTEHDVFGAKNHNNMQCGVLLSRSFYRGVGFKRREQTSYQIIVFLMFCL